MPEISAVKHNVGEMFQEVQELRKEVESLQQQVPELVALKESVALLQGAQPSQVSTEKLSPSSAGRKWSVPGELRKEVVGKVEHVEQELAALKGSMALFRKVQEHTPAEAAGREVESLQEALAAQQKDMASVWKEVGRQKEEFGALQQSASGVAAVKAEVWSVWETVRRQRQDISTLQQSCQSTAALAEQSSAGLAALTEEAKALVASLEADDLERQRLRADLEAEALERKHLKADLESKTRQIEELLSEAETRSSSAAAPGRVPSRAASGVHSPALQASQAAWMPMTPERLSPLIGRSASSRHGSPSSWQLDLQDLPARLNASASRRATSGGCAAPSTGCERLDLQEPEGLRCEVDSSFCKRIDTEAPDEADLARQYSCASYNCDWLDIKAHTRSERRESDESSQGLRQLVAEVSARVADLASSSTEFRVRQDLLELGLTHMQDLSSIWLRRQALRAEVLDLGFIPGGFCRGDTVYAERDEQRNAEFWHQLQRDYSCTPLRVLGAAEDHGKVQLVCAAYGTDLVVDFCRLTKSQH